MIFKIIYSYYCKWYWKSINKHNFSRIGKNKTKKVMNLIKSGNLTVGRGSYGALNIDTTGDLKEGLHIGAFCSISSQCTFLLSGEHPMNSLLTYPFDIIYFHEDIHALSKGMIFLEDDVWIGDQALILSGVKIGQGAVVGAGSLVTKNVPPYAVVGGVPAKIIKYRFSQDIIDTLLEYDIESIKVNEKTKKYLYNNITKDNLIEILETMEKANMIKKRNK